MEVALTESTGTMKATKRLTLAVTASCILAILVLVVSAPPDTEVRSMIVQGRDLATVKSAVAAVGGEISHELSIIDAVGARLTTAQLNTLRDLDGIRRVYENRGIGITEVDDTISITVADDFESASWANDDGPDDWAQPWQELDPQSGGAGTSVGQVRITGGGLRLDDTPDTGGFPSAARRVDLSGANVAFLSFDFHTTDGLDTNDAIAVEVSRGDPGCASCLPSDSMYSLLESVEGFSGANQGSRSYNISEYISSGFHVRFRVARYYGAEDEFFYVDHLTITASGDGQTVPDDTGDGSDPEQSAQPSLVFDKKIVYWPLANTGLTPVTLDELDVAWPAANGELKRVTLGNRKLVNDKLAPDTAVISGAHWEGELADRRIEAGDTLMVGLEFSSDISDDFRDYDLSARFFEGGTADYIGADQPLILAGGETLAFDSKKVDWRIDNHTDATVRIAAITLTWPADNGELKKVKLDGDEISKVEQLPATALIAGAWEGDADRREIAPYSSEVLNFEFDEDVGRSEKLYTIEVAFDNGETVVFTPSNAACRVAPEQSLLFDKNELLWTITSADQDLITVEQFDLGWPSINGALKKIRLNGKEIYKVEQDGPTAVIAEDWNVKMPEREIAPGASAEFLLEFDDEALADGDVYGLGVQFAEGCSAENSGDCELVGDDTLSFDKKKARWVLYNVSAAESVTLDSLAMSWPKANGTLKKIKLAGKEIFKLEQQAPSASISSDWAGNVGDRTIPADGSAVLELEFKSDADTDSALYALAAHSSGGCPAEFVVIGDGMPGTGDVLTDGHPVLETHYPSLIEADQVHAEGITGRGMTVAFLDTGNSLASETIHYNAAREWRYLGQYDAIKDRELFNGDSGFGKREQDEHGHGGHLASVALSAKQTPDGRYNGIAPGADLVTVKAFDYKGRGSYLDVIRGIGWVVANKDLLGIRVLNLSFGAPPFSHYWDDPLNQAVMAAWQAGIVVVASAGNTGPLPKTVGVPGNVPYVVTVGAMTDNFTPEDVTDDRLASFTAAGPTYEGFVKPDLVAPGGHLLGMMGWYTERGQKHKDYRDRYPYFEMSGTSQAAAVLSGVAALVLEADPALSPDDVKCRLMASANPAVRSDGWPAYSVLQQGTGLVNAYDAVYGIATGCANRGLDIAADLAGIAHFGGPVNEDARGNFYLMDADGNPLTNSYSSGHMN